MRTKLILLLIITSFAFACKVKSLDEKIKLDKERLISELITMCEKDQYYRNALEGLKVENKNDRKLKYDSIWDLQERVDMENTRRLIEITKKYGFPNPDRIGEPLPTWVIFQHSPKIFFDELSELLKVEHANGRLYDNEYAMIKWHMGGREGTPFIPGVEVIDNRIKDTIK